MIDLAKDVDGLPSSIDVVGRMVRVRPLSIDDASALYDRYFSDEQCARFLLRERHRSLDKTIEIIRKLAVPAFPAGRRLFGLTIECNETVQPVGLLTCISFEAQIEVHYGVSRRCWGKGLASEALQLASDAFLALDRFKRVYTVCAVENQASLRVLEKAGFRRERHCPECFVLPALGDARQDGYLYAKYLLTQSL